MPCRVPAVPTGSMPAPASSLWPGLQQGSPLRAGPCGEGARPRDPARSPWGVGARPRNQSARITSSSASSPHRSPHRAKTVTAAVIVLFSCLVSWHFYFYSTFSSLLVSHWLYNYTPWPFHLQHGADELDSSTIKERLRENEQKLSNSGTMNSGQVKQAQG